MILDIPFLSPLSRRALLGLLILLVALFGGMPATVLAQKDNSPEFQIQAGAYRISGIGDPSRLSLGAVLYTITVVNSENSQPVSDARVIVNARRESDGTAGWATALHQPSNPGTYKATMQLDGPGAWLTSVDVSSPLGRVEVDTPSVTVPKPRQTRSGSLVFFGAFLAIASGGAYIVWSSRKAIKARRTASEN